MLRKLTRITSIYAFIVGIVIGNIGIMIGNLDITVFCAIMILVGAFGYVLTENHARWME